LALAIGFTACNKEEVDNPPADKSADYSRGTFVINEGLFPNGTGSVTYMSRDGSDIVDGLYQKANENIPLGNNVQSINVYPIGGEHAFITVSNANKVELVNSKTFEKVRTLENITNPRYVEFSTTYGKAYISSWDNSVKVYNLDGTESYGTVATGTGPEKMLEVNDQIWVLNQGGFSIDSTITIIDTETDQVVETIQVYSKPTGIQQDKDGNVWIICSGNGWNGFPQEDDSEGHLVCMDPDDYSIIADISFPTVTEHPEKLVINDERDVLFYNYVDGIYRFEIQINELSESAFIQRPAMFYGLGMDITANIIYASDPLDFLQNGVVYRYDAANGELIDSFEAGIGPGEFYIPPILVKSVD